jgi:hypothetical protein
MPKPRPKDEPRAWIGDLAAMVFWPLFSLLLLVILAVGLMRFVGRAP